MHGQEDIKTTIEQICAYAAEAVQQSPFETNSPAYVQYTSLFSALLTQYAHNVDSSKQDMIADLVRLVFQIYDNTNGSQEKFATYIETLIIQLKNDPDYLQRWSIQSPIDAFLDTADLEDPLYDLEEYVRISEAEIDAALNLYHQKANTDQEILSEDGDFPDEDIDLLDTEMRNLYALSIEDLQASLARHDRSNRFAKMIEIVTESELDATTTQASETDSNHRSLSAPSSPSLSEDISFTGEDEENTARLDEFSEKFGTIIKDFQDKFAEETMPTADNKKLEQVASKITKELNLLHQACFVTTVTAENLDAFDTAAGKMIQNWDYHQNGDAISYRSKALLTQALSKLLIHLLKLTDETRDNLQKPSNSITHTL